MSLFNRDRHRIPDDPRKALAELVSIISLRDYVDERPGVIEYRKALACAVVKADKPPVEDALELFTHNDWAVRDYAILLLGEMRAIEAEEALMMMLEEGKCNDLSARFVAIALEKIGTATSIQAANDWREKNDVSDVMTKQDEITWRLGYFA